MIHEPRELGDWRGFMMGFAKRIWDFLEDF